MEMIALNCKKEMIDLVAAHESNVTGAPPPGTVRTATPSSRYLLDGVPVPASFPATGRFRQAPLNVSGKQSCSRSAAINVAMGHYTGFKFVPSAHGALPGARRGREEKTPLVATTAHTRLPRPAGRSGRRRAALFAMVEDLPS